MKRLPPPPCLVWPLMFAVLGSLGCAGSGRPAEGAGGGGLRVDSLACERRVNPLAVDSPEPRLSWVLASDQRGQRQTAYRVLVAASPEQLADERGDLWDSGKVASRETLNVVYAGRPLASGQTCYWKVRVWDRDDQASGWSEPGAWEMSLLHERDWAATWLNDGKANPSNDADFYAEDPAPLFRKEFVVRKAVRRARLHITGLGYYEASLNGRRVGDHVLDPGWTAYDRRVLYSTYDVTDAVRPGANCLGVVVGNGWYNPLPLRMWGHLNLREHLGVGRPRFIARLSLDYADGTGEAVVSDLSWKTSDGPIRSNSIYLGEVYDARSERPGWDEPGYDDSGWRSPAAAGEPVGPLQPQGQPPIRVTERIACVRVTEPRPGVFIHDLGQNFSGWVTLRLEHPLPPAGTRVVLRYGELLNDDGTLNPMTSVCGQIKGRVKNARGEEESVGGPGAPAIAWQSDTYITRGAPGSAGGGGPAEDGAEVYTPRFTFHGFRYVEVTGLGPSAPRGRPIGRVTVTGLRLHSDVADAGAFACSSDLLNRIQQMCRRTFLANLFSVQSDCPHRERFGYGGDIAATSEALMLNFDMAAFYAKTVRDFTDAARPDGLLTDTAPFVGIQYCGVGWAMAHPLLLSQLRRQYGDERLMGEHYEPARRWLLRVGEAYPEGIIREGLSDHEGLEPAPAPQMVTPLYVQSAELLAEMARALQRDEDAAVFDSLARRIRRAFQKAFPPGTDPATQASMAFALSCDLVPEDDRAGVLRALVENIRVTHQGRLSTGILGTKFMLDVLARMGRADVAFDIVNRRDYPGWGWMLENGATTLWEHWALDTNTFSHSHPMFGSVSQWFFNWLAGIQPAPGALGFDSILIRPQPVEGLDWVRSSHRSVRGDIVSNWRRDEHRFVLDVEIPVGASALVHLPAERIEHVTESGRSLAAPGVADVEVVAAGGPGAGVAVGEVVCRVGSGRYRFVVHRPRRQGGSRPPSRRRTAGSPGGWRSVEC